MPRLTRRDFVAATSAAAISTGFHSSLSAQKPTPSIRVCIAGLNGRGGEHMRGFHQNPNTEITAVVDIDPAAAKKAADRIAKMQGKAPAIFSDVRKAIDDDSVDVLSVATPNHWHALMGCWAMQAGKHVYCEKPISHNITEGRALVDAAAKYDRVFQTGTQCRSSTAIQEAVEYIAAGKIGECNFARGLCYKRRKSIGELGDYPIPAEVDFDLWAGPATITDPPLTRPQFHYDWHWQRHYGNGDLGNQGPHQTDIARWGLGLNRHPQRVITYGGRLGYQAERKDPSYIDAGNTANTEISLYDYGDKSIVFETRGLDVSETAGAEVDAMFGDQKGNRIGVIFYGSEGFLAQTQYHQCKAFDKNMKLVKTFESRNVGDMHFANFIDAILSGDKSGIHADAMTGHLSAAVSHLGNISYYLGETNHQSVDQIAETIESFPTGDDNVATLKQTVEHLEANGVDLEKYPLSLGPDLAFDPETERFTGNEDANALLTREYRPGFELPGTGKA